MQDHGAEYVCAQSVEKEKYVSISGHSSKLPEVMNISTELNLLKGCF
jgi:hypothetical protein